jgi:hypothetical protein
MDEVIESHQHELGWNKNIFKMRFTMILPRERREYEGKI